MEKHGGGDRGTSGYNPGPSKYFFRLALGFRLRIFGSVIGNVTLIFPPFGCGYLSGYLKFMRLYGVPSLPMELAGMKNPLNLKGFRGL
jgi:hypothetical protein